MKTSVARLVEITKPHARQTKLMADLGDHAASPGMLFLVDERDERIPEAAFLHLLSRHRDDGRPRNDGGTPSLATSRATAYELSEWFRFLAEGRRKWNAVSQEDLLLYATFLLDSTREHTGRLLESRTVGHKFSSILGFYRFTNGVGLTKVDYDQQALHRKRTRGRAGKQGAKLKEGQIRPFSDEDLARMAKALGPLPTGRAEGSEVPTRDRLLVQTGLVTGMRGEEVCHLRVNSIKDIKIDPERPGKLHPVKITKTKGKDCRTVPIRAELILELQRYVQTERKAAVKAWSARHGSDHGYVFVNHAGSSRPGAQLKTNTIHRRFHALMLELELVDGKPRTKKGVTAEAVIALHSYHDLRHTFAIKLYLRLKRLSAKDDVFREALSEPWAAVAVALGHEDWTTTKEVYLKAPGLFLASIGETLHDDFEEA